MKKSLLALTAAAALAIAGSAIAMPGMGAGQGMGPGMKAQMGQAGALTPEMKKFIADTMPIREEMHAKHMQLQKEMIKDAPLDMILPQIPMGRVGNANEVADLVVFLLSESAGYITRQVISVNGGLA